jgi:hypothetical protein
MPIPPISSRSSTGPYPSDWQKICDQMQARISNYLNNGQMDQLGGYLSTMMQFAEGLGDNTPQKVAFTQAIIQLYTDAGTRGNWQKDLANIKTLFPPNISADEMRQAFKNILASNTETMPGQNSADYISGLQTSLNDLLGLASNKDAQILRSPGVQDPIDEFINDPDEDHAEALHAAIKAAINEL